MKKWLSLILILVLCLSLFACGPEEEEGYLVPQELEAMYTGLMETLDPGFAYDVAVELSENPEYWSSDLGGRNAGSPAEHKAADYLVGLMEDIGLTEVEKVGAECDLWSNNGSTLEVDGTYYDVYAYACAPTPPEGITSEILFMGDGSMWDYEDVDVTGKIVLIDIDQRANWWITYPMLEAEFQGAAAIMSAQVSGFSEIADDALNCQDICAPISIPCVSIGLADSQALQGKMESGPVMGTLVVDNDININEGTTYNVMGKIPGKSSENQIIIGAHYDVHFHGFQDNSCAVGLAMAMAKGMVDAGYVPENDIIFCMHGAEEWGSFGTQYDWTVGAWEMINREHPEWVGKTLAFVNFELPAYEFDTYTSTYSPPELYNMLDFFANTYPLSPQPEGCFPDGVLTEGYQTYTYSDDFSYYAAGVPSVINGFLLQQDMENVFDFYLNYYHSNYDLPDLYNEAVMTFNLKYYTAMTMYFDQMPALYLDFTPQYDRIMASIDEGLMVEAGIDMDTYYANLEALKSASEEMATQVIAVNDAYLAAWSDGDEDAMAERWAEGKALTHQNLEAFQFAQDAFLGLMYERPIVRHESPQENIQLCRLTIDALEEGDVVTAADEYAWAINNVLEWYAMYFSPEVIQIQDDMFWNPNNMDNLYWGTGKQFQRADVEAATRSVFLRYEEEGGDFTEEIQIYQDAIDQQMMLLKELGEQEALDLVTLSDMIALK
ncbi:MAG: M28 family peptidase [Clostridia bacterium]|nr:M28 family peptidase [Clostridia bacterium]